MRGIAQLVEHNLAKVGVASGLKSESRFLLRTLKKSLKNFTAGIAQLVEHNLAKVGVASSSLVSRSNLVLSVKFNLVKVGVVSL